MAISFTINGKPANIDAAPETPLLWVVREHLQLTGTKYGCGVGMCGACTVHLDGRAVRSCQTPVAAVAGKSVTTIEGLSANGDHPLQQAWVATAGAAMRLLPVRADHAGRRLARGQQKPEPRRHRPPHGREYLPLRHLSPHRPRHRARRQAGSLSHGYDRAQSGRHDLAARLPRQRGRPHLRAEHSRRPDRAAGRGAGGRRDAPGPIGAWVTIGPDGAIVVAVPAAEMGQGSLTGLAMVFAEELDADWSRVTTVYPPVIPSIFGNPIFGGQMVTYGSGSVRGYWDKVRLQAAAVRRVLMQAAADHWQVPLAELHTEPSMVVHAADQPHAELRRDRGLRPGAGDDAGGRQVRAQETRGLPHPRQDDAAHSTFRPRPPARPSSPSTFRSRTWFTRLCCARRSRMRRREHVDDGAALAVPGVLKIVPMEHSVGIVADSVEAAFAGRDGAAGELVERSGRFL